MRSRRDGGEADPIAERRRAQAGHGHLRAGHGHLRAGPGSGGDDGDAAGEVQVDGQPLPRAGRRRIRLGGQHLHRAVLPQADLQHGGAPRRVQELFASAALNSTVTEPVPPSELCGLAEADTNVGKPDPGPVTLATAVDSPARVACCRSTKPPSSLTTAQLPPVNVQPSALPSWRLSENRVAARCRQRHGQRDARGHAAQVPARRAGRSGPKVRLRRDQGR